jgi:hypothetical protein
MAQEPLLVFLDLGGGIGWTLLCFHGECSLQKVKYNPFFLNRCSEKGKELPEVECLKNRGSLLRVPVARKIKPG